MQKLQLELKNVPVGASQAHCSTNSQLNKDKSLSVVDKVLDCNNPDVNQHQHTGGFKNIVYVLSINNIPLMPCSPAKCRKLLKSGNAKVIKLYPFTIKLNFECENKIQGITLGIDTGYKNIGFSAVSNDKELISGTLILDDKTSERISERRMYRRNRRNRHHWYRKPRFNNRKRNEDWLPPSIQRRYDTHLNLINKLKSILPITNIIVETASFDIQKIENAEITGIGYQQGDMYDYQNIRSYLFAREKGICQLCGKKIKKGEKINLHHCLPKLKKGSDRAKNLALLHEKCHIKLHKQNLKIKQAKTLKSETFMSIVHKRFCKEIPNLKLTYGYITNINRNKLNLEKSHYNDAFVIAGGKYQIRIKSLIIKQKHRNNRSIQLNRKGFKPLIRKQRYYIQPKDLVWINGEKYITNGIHCNGKRIILEKTKKSINVNNIEKVFNFGSFVWN